MSAQSPVTIPVFDGHNDTLLSLLQTGRSFFERSGEGHIDLPRAQEGGLLGGFFAIWVPNLEVGIPDFSTGGDDEEVNLYDSVDTMPAPMPLQHAMEFAVRRMGAFERIVKESNGKIRAIRTADDLRQSVKDGVFAAELHFEGAEPIDPELETLDAYYAAGLRSIGFVWSRPNAFGFGVPFGFPSSPDTGPGLTDAGKNLVRACNRLGILIDLAHLNEKGFWDVAELSDAPLVSTHTAAHAICASARNLTDKQLAAVKASNGMVGCNFHVGFLNPQGGSDADTPISTLCDHIDYLVERLGIDCVGFGSDFDGAVMSNEFKDAAGMQKIVAALRDRGYDDASLRKMATENWIRIFDATWKN